MLAANVSVAEQILKHFTGCSLLRLSIEFFIFFGISCSSAISFL